MLTVLSIPRTRHPDSNTANALQALQMQSRDARSPVRATNVFIRDRPQATLAKEGSQRFELTACGGNRPNACDFPTFDVLSGKDVVPFKVDSEIIERHPSGINRASACLRDLGQHRSYDLSSVSTVLCAPHYIAPATAFVGELNASVNLTVAFSNETFSFSRHCLILLHSEMRLESLSKTYPLSYPH